MKKVFLAILFLTMAPSAWATNWFVRSSTACPTNGNGTSSSCASSPGGAGAWSGFSNIVWGSVHAGDTLFLQSGDTYAETMTVASSGSNGSPILITVNGSGTVTLDEGNLRTGFDFGGQAFVTIDGVRGSAAMGGSQVYGIRVINIGVNQYCGKIRNGEHDIKALHIECTGTVETGTSDEVGGFSAQGMGAQVSSTQLEIAYNWVHGPTPTSGGSSTCDTFSNTRHMWCATGIKTFPPLNGTSFTNTLIHDNLVQNMFNDGIDSSQNSSIYRNEVSGVFGSGHSDSIQIQSGSYSQMYSNYVHDSNDQNCYLDNASLGTTAHVRVYNNIFSSPLGFGGCNIDPEGNGSGSVWDDVVVANNTFFSSHSYNIHWSGRGTITNLVVKNNISGTSGADGAWPIDTGGGTTFAAGNLDYDAYSPSGTQFPIVAHLIGGLFTLAQLQSNSLEVHGKACDVTYATGSFPTNFTPFLADTCARGNGVNLTSTYSFLTTDFSGNARPAVGNWDMGALIAQSGAVPALSFSPSPATFGSQTVGTTSSPVTITVSNTGTAPQILATPYFTITGTNSTNFANAGTGTCANGGTIPASASCTVILTFTPSATGARTATLTIQGTVFGTDTLNGTGTSPAISMSPSPAAFGNQVVSTTSGPLTVTVSNTGTSSQILATPFFTITGTNSSNFANAGTGSCANGGTIAASSSCTINLTFTPSATGARSAVLTVNGTVSATDNLTGTGTQAALSFSPSPGAFGNQNINTTSSPLTITITNTGTAADVLQNPYFTITGTNASEFVNAGTGTCTNGGTIAVSGSCTVNLTFTPTAAGARSASLNILGLVNGLDSLTGTGVAPLASVSPTSIAFGNQTTGTSSGNQAVTLSNPGTATLTISSISLIGADAGQFSTNGSTCGGTLAASATCTLNVVFSPTTIGAKTATLRFATNAASSPNDVSLTGTGVAPAVPVLSFSPGIGAFGNQLQGSTSSPITITVSNVGTASEVLATPFFTLTGPNPTDFARTGGTCANAGTIAVSGSCTIIVTFTPASTGGRAASLNILGTANGSVALTGTGTLPSISLAPSPGAFGNQLQGTTSAPLTITVSNTGTGTETLATPYWTITGTNPTNFANLGTGTCSNGGTIAPSASCTVNLSFTPSGTGARSATLTIQGTVNGTDSLTGTGTLPVIGLSPATVGFGNQAVSTTSSPITVTISNTGTASEVLATPYFSITGTNASNFANAGTGTCANGGTIAASSSCTVNLTFTPSATGVRNATFTLIGTVNATAPLVGTGTAATVSLSPTSIAFGNQTQGTSSGNQTVTLTNPGNATLTITSIALTGVNLNQFSTNGSTCAGTLAAASSCSINVVFSPTSTGAKTASLTFTTSAASSPDNVSLTGTGTAVAVPALSFSPTSVDFGSVNVGITSGTVTVTVTNVGTANEVLSTPYFVIGGTNATNFANPGGGSCVNGATIAPSSSCTVSLTFTPSATGSRAGTLTIQGTVNGSIVLSGTGTAFGGVSLNPTTINFGNQDDGTSSSPTAVVLTNTGTATLTISSITLTGTNASEFSINGNTCGTVLASGTCTWNVVFSPLTAGSKSAAVTITSDASSSPDSLPLTGTGRVPTPPSQPAPAITIVTILPPGSVVVSAPGMGVSPRYAIASSAGCSQDGVNFQNPCRFSISCGNCKNATARFNGTLVSSSFSKGTVTVSVPIALIPPPANATNYQISLSN